MPQRDARGDVGVAELELREHVLTRRVEVELALVDQRMTTVAVQTLVIDPIWKTSRTSPRAGGLVQEAVRDLDPLVVLTVADTKDAERRSGNAVLLGELGEAALPVLRVELRQRGAARVAGVLLTQPTTRLLKSMRCDRVPSKTNRWVAPG